MRITFRGAIDCVETRSRLSSALKVYGVSKAARELRRSPGRLSNLCTGNDQSMPLELLLELETLLGVDLLGDARGKLSRQLRELSDQVNKNNTEDIDQPTHFLE